MHDAGDFEAVWHLYLMTEILIGRVNHCYVRLYDKSVSRVHCRIYHYNGQILIDNASKTNSTILNGNIITSPAVLNIGDTIKCGHVTLVVNTIYTC